ncbi:hypothetical protein P3W24_10685 [Luteibacter sp. PPL201]|uniref:Uncharacterized protein n=1 Tax=Luteibacter sahnii TaxID=3021977 RepID=A0ABT6BBB8_9GAMM|nr:hypothetical protein [Luteibacter sp. PPL193]MDY1547405.1 hypothetical protein [Luteibacter sp. PPL193]
MNTRTSRSAVAALVQGAIAAMQWRLWLLWVLISLLPTLLVALPLWTTLDGLLGYSVHADAWASHLDGWMMADVTQALGGSDWLTPTVAAGALLTLLLSPFLAAMAVSAGRAGRALGFGALLQGGAADYGRLLRLYVPALLPYGLVVLAGRAVMPMADRHVESALSQGRADLYHDAALALVVLCFVIAQAIVESARAQFIADPTLRSALRAFGRGVVQFVRRPFACLGIYLVITLFGGGLDALVAAWRGHVTAAGSGVVWGFVVVQLGVIVVAWMRTARLIALSGLTAGTATQRRRSALAPAF